MAKRIAQRSGARTFAGAELLRVLDRRRKLAVIGRGAVHMFRAAAAWAGFDIVGSVANTEVGTRMLAGDEATARNLDRFAAMGHRRPERSLAAAMRVAARRSPTPQVDREPASERGQDQQHE